MMMPSHKVRILVATQSVDFRKGHDGLASLVQSVLLEDPFTGTVFVFRAKRADRFGYGLQAPGGDDVHVACDQGWPDDAEPGAIRSAVCGVGLA
jgi:hypothetical protein